jgi:hypothetical protein
MTDVLSAKQQAFVSAYLSNGNAAAAAQQAGYSPRTASRLLREPNIAAAITAGQAEAVTDARLTTSTLLAEAEAAYQAAAAAGNAAGMCAAVTLKAKLSGLLDVDPPASAPEPPPRDPADVARAILSVLHKAKLDGDSGVQVGFAGPGESLLRTRDPDLATTTTGAKPALRLDEVAPPPAPVPAVWPAEARRPRRHIRLGYASSKPLPPEVR